MTKDEMKQIWAVLAMYRPRDRKLKDPQLKALWFETLQPFSFEDVKAAIVAHFRETRYAGASGGKGDPLPLWFCRWKPSRAGGSGPRLRHEPPGGTACRGPGYAAATAPQPEPAACGAAMSWPSEQTFPLPNALILDGTLTFTAHRVGAALYSLNGGNLQITLSELSHMARISITTIRGNLQELEVAGYIRRQRKLQYNTSQIHLIPPQDLTRCTFTHIPRSALALPLQPRAFCVLLYLLYLGWPERLEDRPDAKTISTAIRASKATVYRGLGEIRAVLKEKERKGETEYAGLPSSFL